LTKRSQFLERGWEAERVSGRLARPNLTKMDRPGGLSHGCDLTERSQFSVTVDFCLGLDGGLGEAFDETKPILGG
jgi:hypothetical protein